MHTPHPEARSAGPPDSSVTPFDGGVRLVIDYDDGWAHIHRPEFTRDRSVERDTESGVRAALAVAENMGWIYDEEAWEFMDDGSAKIWLVHR